MPRYDLPGTAQHVIQRGNNRQPVFFEPSDYNRYLSDLAEVASQHQCAIHAYVLMTNHVHLLVTPLMSGALPKTMQSLGRRYVAYINRRYRRTGTLWEGRYKACLVQSDTYLLTCHRYIENNPVRAGMVSTASDYPYSSHRSNAYGASSSLLTPHESYLQLGATSTMRRQRYLELFESELPHRDAELRSNTEACLAFGSAFFKDEIERQIRRRLSPGRRGRPIRQE